MVLVLVPSHLAHPWVPEDSRGWNSVGGAAGPWWSWEVLWWLELGWWWWEVGWWWWEPGWWWWEVGCWSATTQVAHTGYHSTSFQRY